MITDRLRVTIVIWTTLVGAGAAFFMHAACAQHAGSPVAQVHKAKSRFAQAPKIYTPTPGEVISSRNDPFSGCGLLVGSNVAGPQILGVVRIYLTAEILKNLPQLRANKCTSAPMGSCLATAVSNCKPGSTICTKDKEDDDGTNGVARAPGQWRGDLHPTNIDVNIHDFFSKAPQTATAKSAVLIKVVLSDPTISFVTDPLKDPDDSTDAIFYGQPLPTAAKMLSCRSTILSDAKSGFKYIVFRVTPPITDTFNNLAFQIDLPNKKGRLVNFIFKFNRMTYDPKIMSQT